MNLSEMRDLIRAEANLEGAKEYSTLIDSIINQELQALTGKAKYAELLSSYVFTSPADQTHSFPIPTDFQLIDSVTFNRFDDINPNRGYTLSRGIRGMWQSNINGYPKYYTREAGFFQIYPYTSFFLNDFVTVSYYRKPILILETDEFPIVSIEKAVIQATMGRMLRLVDTKRAQLATQDAEKSFMESRAEDAGN